MLTFTIDGDRLLIGGSSFRIKENIKMLGGSWKGGYWTLPAHLDCYSLRKDLQDAFKAIRQKAKEERDALAAWANSPEGLAAAAAEQREHIRLCIKEKVKTGAYHWICCADCIVLDWRRQHTTCTRCAEWDGQSWNTIRVRGGLYTGT